MIYTKESIKIDRGFLRISKNIEVTIREMQLKLRTYVGRILELRIRELQSDTKETISHLRKDTF